MESAKVEMAALLAEARRLFRARNSREAAHVLSQAEAIAKHGGLHREAAQFRQALVILSQGGRPKLLARSVPKSSAGPGDMQGE